MVSNVRCPSPIPGYAQPGDPDPDHRRSCRHEHLSSSDPLASVASVAVAAQVASVAVAAVLVFLPPS